MVRKKKVVKKRNSEKASPEKTKMVELPVTFGIQDESGSVLDKHNLSWIAPEFFYHEKPAWWHIAVYSFMGALIILMIFLQEWFAIVVFLLLGFLIYRYSEIKPKDIEIALTDVGIKVGNRFYPFNQIRAFWVVYDPSIRTLNLELTKRFSPIISIELMDTDPVRVKELLRQHVLEDTTRTEDIIERFTRLIRF